MKEFWFEIVIGDDYVGYGTVETVIGTEKDIFDFVNDINAQNDGSYAIIIAQYE